MLKSKQVVSDINFAKRLESDGMNGVNLFHAVFLKRPVRAKMGDKPPFGLSCFACIHARVDFKLLAGCAFNASISSSFHFEIFPIRAHWCTQDVATTRSAACEASA